MYINSLYLQNFRNIKNANISFSPNLNVLVGNNGMGKTNVLESIYFLSIGKSPRAVKDIECINFEESNAKLGLEFIRNKTPRKINLNLFKNQKKTLLLDNMPLKKLSDIVGHFGSVYFSPIELQIISGAPTLRRRFIDIINCQLSPQYMDELFKYQRAIKQRNNYLKAHKTNEYNTELESWDVQIASLCASLTKRRQVFIERLNGVAKEIHKNITNNIEQIDIKYISCIDDIKDASFDEIKTQFLQKMKQNFEKDRVLEYTSFGCHNDDIDVKLQYLKDNQVIKTINIKKSGSQGQQRTSVLSMKLAELEILKDEYYEPPVLLLDDVLGELDKDRQNALLNYCKNFQTIITCTEWKYKIDAKIFEINNGVITLKQ